MRERFRASPGSGSSTPDKDSRVGGVPTPDELRKLLSIDIAGTATAASPTRQQRRIAAGHVRLTGNLRLMPKPSDFRQPTEPGDRGFELTDYTLDLPQRAKEAHHLTNPTEMIKYMKDATDYTDGVLAKMLGKNMNQIDYYLRRGGLRTGWVKGDFAKRFYNVLGIVFALEIMHPGGDEDAKALRREEMRKWDDKRLDGRTYLQVLTGKKDESAKVLGAIQQSLGEQNGRITPNEGIEDDRVGTLEEI